MQRPGVRTSIALDAEPLPGKALPLPALWAPRVVPPVPKPRPRPSPGTQINPAPCVQPHLLCALRVSVCWPRRGTRKLPLPRSSGAPPRPSNELSATAELVGEGWTFTKPKVRGRPPARSTCLERPRSSHLMHHSMSPAYATGRRWPQAQLHSHREVPSAPQPGTDPAPIFTRRLPGHRHC